MANFDYPKNTPLVDDQGMPTPSWQAVFARWHAIIITSQQSGPTAQRPIKGLYVGRQWYDETLNKPVYFSALPAVWRDAAGTIV